ncbi:dTDP-4-dehydrorhamnose reductase [Amycolatopsis regifaucium]|uniref:dTDP-4-dehydrorhamnose reductase n=1 Tax=Amycolatopsis regifaucium TaxID=546365 RepID=A0A154MDS2_9PSEU|nr:dTDP-4-dehydrorhamnose reductase [Amycolatopsis regifaucium]KZB82317.1 NAD(P)-dependent oxidoreductase [Amycolatopsis regifaucium]OKA10289.1 dTDP-4-dehydrorhamnose reductase [Amycolatopsis regifaucium]SFG89631.1 dTDP-4-dehydrorhamnose reductase [Amycolatopsis regifaucium]
MTVLSLLVPGGSGQLGQDIAALVPDAVTPSSAELNVRDTGQVIAAVTALAARARAAGTSPVVINAAAYTAVDAAEADEERAFAVNADGPRVLAAACSSRGVPLIHVSTDYVFAGDATSPYEPGDRLGPLNAYGRTKAAGEDAVLGSGARSWIVRTSWVYGKTGSNFVKTMARLEKEREELSVVDDQTGSPTWSRDLAAGLLELAGRVAAGEGPAQRVLHCTGGGSTTWCGFARAIFAELGADPARVKPCTTAEFPRPATRPAYGVLSNASWREAGLTPLRDWTEALKAYFAS